MKRFIEQTVNGPVLMEVPEGSENMIRSVGATELVELNVTDEQWTELKRLQTDGLDFATVKKNYGITEEPK